MPKIKKGKIITVTSMKGGVGKTLTVLQLAAILKKAQKRVLIMDLDLYNGDIAFALNLDVKGSIYNLCDDVANNRYKGDSKENYVIKYDEYIDIITSPKDPRQASKIDRKYLEVILRSFSHKYDVILIDTNHILSVTNMVAFECSKVILDIFTNDSFDIKNTKNFISICKNMDVDNLVLVLNSAINEGRGYYSSYDIESIIKSKINYTIPKRFYIRGLDKYVVNGTLLEACEKILKDNAKEATKLSNFVLNLLKDYKGDEANEEK